MVKIDANNPIHGIQGQNGNQAGKKITTGEFDSALRAAIGSASTTQASKAESTHFLGDIRPARFEKTDAAPETKVVDQTRRLIDTLDIYRQQLKDNENTVKDIQGLIQEIESQSGALKSALTEVGEQKGLSDIVNQTLMLSSMEIARFNSGHYN